MLRGNGYTVVANEDVAELDFPHVTELWWQDQRFSLRGLLWVQKGRKGFYLRGEVSLARNMRQ